MAFQPFGFRFEINSTMPPEEAKAALRSGMKGWFEPKNAPRGWIVGPLICLWASAFNEYGPLLMGWISRDNFGTRVRGRAGSDLNGIAFAALVFPFLAYMLYRMILDGSATAGQILLIGGILLIGTPLTFWWAHKERREAEPLVSFVRRTLRQATRSPKQRVAAGLAHQLRCNSSSLRINGTARPPRPKPFVRQSIRFSMIPVALSSSNVKTSTTCKRRPRAAASFLKSVRGVKQLISSPSDGMELAIASRQKR